MLNISLLNPCRICPHTLGDNSPMMNTFEFWILVMQCTHICDIVVFVVENYVHQIPYRILYISNIQVQTPSSMW